MFWGTNNLDVVPLFADAANVDFHLKSAAGRWTSSGWVTDSETSLCIDAGNPQDDYSNEPSPNGGIVNMGYYGNTNQASKSGLYPLKIELRTSDQDALPSDAKWYLNGDSSTLYSSNQVAIVFMVDTH